jgi:hypothetical protein
VIIPLGIDLRDAVRTRSDKRYAHATDRKRAQRDRLKDRQDEIMNGLMEAVESKQDKYIIDDCHGYSFNTVECVTSLQGSIIAHKRDRDSMMLACDKETFISTMKQFSKSRFVSVLLCSSIRMILPPVEVRQTRSVARTSTLISRTEL